METAFEHALTNSYKDDMIAYLTHHSEDFDEAIELAISNKQPYSWRAAWLLWSCMDDNDPRVQGYIKRIIDSLGNKEDGHQRELIKILHRMNLDDESEGYLFDVCVSIWEKVGKNPSVRMTAFKFIVKIAQRHPDLSLEIALLTQNQYLETLSPAVKKAISKMIKPLDSPQ